MKANLRLNRDTYTDNSTIGRLYINDIFFCDTLEDKCRDINKDGDLDDPGEQKVQNETAIPSGIYKFILVMSPNFKTITPRLIGVKGFADILIHWGNTKVDTHGCILVGLTRTKDFVGQSKEAFEKLMIELKKYDDLEINIIDLK